MESSSQIQSTLLNYQPKDNKKYSIGVEGNYAWLLRLFTPLLLILVIIIDTFWSAGKNKQTSDKFHLWVTPKSIFFLIWPVIYAGVIIVNIWNLVTNQWSLKAHYWFGMTNILSVFWTFVFDRGTRFSTFFSSLLLVSLTLSLLFLWIELGQIPRQKINWVTYFNRNVFAFYLGWVIAATNINIGMDIVYWWGFDKQTQMYIFWIATPLIAILVFIFNCTKYGKFGMKSCLCVWLSVMWAFVGAFITSYNCKREEQELC